MKQQINDEDIEKLLIEADNIRSVYEGQAKIQQYIRVVKKMRKEMGVVKEEKERALEEKATVEMTRDGYLAKMIKLNILNLN